MSGVVFFVVWITCLFFFALAWKAAAVFCGRYLWAARAAALALLIRPVMIGFAPMPVIFGFLIYGSPNYGDHSELVRCATSAGSTALIAWLILEAASRANKFAEDHKHLNPLLNKKQ